MHDINSDKAKLWRDLKRPMFETYGCETCIHSSNEINGCDLDRSVTNKCRLVGTRISDFKNPDNKWEWNGETYE